MSVQEAQNYYYFQEYHPTKGWLVDEETYNKCLEDPKAAPYDTGHPPIMKKIPIPADTYESHHATYLLGLGATVIAAGALIGACTVGFPHADAISLLALGILVPVSYGVINDQFACRDCIEYFTVGHHGSHKRILETEDPTLNGIVYGIAGSWTHGLVAGTLMAGAAWATNLSVIPALPYIIPAVALIAGTTGLYAHKKSKETEEIWKKPENQKQLDFAFNNKLIIPEKGGYPVNLNEIPVEKRAVHAGILERNRIAYKAFSSLGALAVAGILAQGILGQINPLQQ